MKAIEEGKNLFIGTSGYYFEDWIGTAYPKATKKSDMLSEYLKLGFNALELNFTYYRLADERQLSGFSKKAPPDFAYLIKAYNKVTHEKAGKDLIRDVAKNYLGGNSNFNFKGMLLQFPESFHKTKENLEYLHMLSDEMKEVRLFAEFRRSDWINEETFAFLKKINLLYVATDLPQIGSLPQRKIETSVEEGYLRLHGKNTNWYTAEDRYDYLYSEGEIREFHADVVKLMQKTKSVFVFFNNCHGGFAVRNALMLQKMIDAGGNN
ncbi:MAG: DUF72 domain-containing protein [bacterium]|nr:DUF72 domain-containing protein [bacterium]